MKSNSILWALWIVGTLVVTGVFISTMHVGGDRTNLLIGETSVAHHQIEMACESCHTSGILTGGEETRLAMNKACLSCHSEELALSVDSHPVKKFKDPRNAERRETLDALFCSTCHAEHVPEITKVGGVTLPMDFCSACHQDVAEERPTHEGFGFDTCATSGCHNFHDNRALYEDFLLKHADAPDFAEIAVNQFSAKTRSPSILELSKDATDPVATLAAYLDGKEDISDPIETAKVQLANILTRDDVDAPKEYLDAGAIEEWIDSGHALGGVNCTGCHTPDLSETQRTNMQTVSENWIDSPGVEVCASCHTNEAATFKLGKHGMRLHPGLPSPRGKDGGVLSSVFKDKPIEAMTVGEARAHMKDSSAHKEIGNCNTCHQPHDVDIQTAAVEACASCHDDSHTQAYFDSPHHELWKLEMSGEGQAGSGVSCADCHMAKIKSGRDDFFTSHNQNDFMRPVEKMVRPVCLSCHSLSFALDALADEDLIANNFNGQSAVHVESIDWAVKRREERERK